MCCAYRPPLDLPLRQSNELLLAAVAPIREAFDYMLAQHVSDMSSPAFSALFACFVAVMFYLGSRRFLGEAWTIVSWNIGL
jgi:hypothetical protein